MAELNSFVHCGGVYYRCWQIPDVEVWFQRASDVVRKLRLGDIDLGIVGYDMFQEIGDEDR
jgi:ATP phosphoribosyltransferase